MATLQKSNSWADEADDDGPGGGLGDVPAPPPVANPWGKTEVVKPPPTGLVFEDFDGPQEEPGRRGGGGGGRRDDGPGRGPGDFPDRGGFDRGDRGGRRGDYEDR
eukprot:CAMPEP_0177709858 /NCGR_PEP_ID=MMETSP0484_2-20121128/11024_1 /TAXON_ID=354590 /ORGANISM="Rhodomonas lens, Strain RHODO" /LENGTH=104 /DNA_ID=CAMNT_0019221497 /DNA_START=351 /DNA_END=662 /DNA_ORIENTATION=-